MLFLAKEDRALSNQDNILEDMQGLIDRFSLPCFTAKKKECQQAISIATIANTVLPLPPRGVESISSSPIVHITSAALPAPDSLTELRVATAAYVELGEKAKAALIQALFYLKSYGGKEVEIGGGQGALEESRKKVEKTITTTKVLFKLLVASSQRLHEHPAFNFDCKAKVALLTQAQVRQFDWIVSLFTLCFSELSSMECCCLPQQIQPFEIDQDGRAIIVPALWGGYSSSIHTHIPGAIGGHVSLCLLACKKSFAEFFAIISSFEEQMQQYAVEMKRTEKDIVMRERMAASSFYSVHGAVKKAMEELAVAYGACLGGIFSLQTAEAGIACLFDLFCPPADGVGTAVIVLLAHLATAAATLDANRDFFAKLFIDLPPFKGKYTVVMFQRELNSGYTQQEEISQLRLHYPLSSQCLWQMCAAQLVMRLAMPLVEVEKQLAVLSNSVVVKRQLRTLIARLQLIVHFVDTSKN